MHIFSIFNTRRASADGILKNGIYFDPAIVGKPSVMAAKASVPTRQRIEVRFLNQHDLQNLMELERAVWDETQAASVTEMSVRITRYPTLAIGAFCSETGRALASLFARPTSLEAVKRARSWQDCVNHDDSEASRQKALFGISLSSIDGDAAKAIFAFFWPHALKNGWQEMYLGSPIPGLRDWIRDNPGQAVENYVFERRKGLPRDRQLCYYHKKGFQRIVAVRREYFPHAASMNYGVVIGGRIPLGSLAPLWKRLPLPWLQAMKQWLFVLQ
ncbi:MAG: hypothetical protein ABI171_21460 [Collimonas sp.]|uniref:hypothetical protein n=1 Tax=Collimonas sp. TaxID=1963772 RepID=UPI003265D7AC